MNPSGGGGHDDAAAAAADAAAVAAGMNDGGEDISNNNNNNINSGNSIMTENPIVFLQSVIHSRSNLNGLQQVAAFAGCNILKQQHNNNSNMAALFLQAAALHLPAATTMLAATTGATAPNHAVATAASAASSSSPGSLVANVTAGVMALAPVASALASMAAASGSASSITTRSGGKAKNNNNNNTNKVNNAEVKMVHQIVEAIGHAVTLVNPRSIIADSGILPVLRRFIPSNNTNRNNNIASSSGWSALSPVHVEFLQACIFAGHYRYALRCILHRHDWPRPTMAMTTTTTTTSSNSSNTNTPVATVTVQHVLRYYYLRGIVHMACQQYLLARRCFWICCTIPSELCSAIAVAAWKKLVLVTCRIQATADTNVIAPLQLPQAAPPCLVGFLTQGRASMFRRVATTFSASSSGQKKQQQQHQLQDPSSPFDQDLYEGFMGVAAAAASGGDGGGGGAPEESSSVMHMVDVDATIMAAPEDVVVGGPQQQQPSSSSSQQQQQQQAQSYQALGVNIYAQLTRAFGQGDYALYQRLMQQHGSLLQSDGNLGLVTQIQQVLRQRQVYLWSRVYSEITTVELSQLLQLSNGVQETLELLVQMSLSTTYGPWPVEIQDQGRIVVFPKWNIYTRYHDDGGEDSEDHGNSTNDNEMLVQDLMVLTSMMQQLDATVASSAKFQSMAARTSSSKETSLSGAISSAVASAAGMMPSSLSRPFGMPEDV